MRIKACLLLQFALPGLLVAPAVVASNDQDVSSQTDNSWEYSFATAALRMPGTALDNGGQTSLTSYHFRARAERPWDSSVLMGVSMNYDAYDHDFSGDQGFAALEPWNRRSRLGFTGSFRKRSRYGWSYGVRPFVSWSAETGELESDAMSYGLAMAVVAGTSRDRRFGVGATVARDIDDSLKVGPIIILDWEINENWTIGNPRETYFTVPGGLEISYREGTWRFGAGAVYQSAEFRLDDRGLAPGGIGESARILSFVRISRQWSLGVSVNAFVGAVINGELTVENADGMEVASDKYDTAPLAALSVEGSF